MKKTTKPFTKRYLAALIVFLLILFIYQDARSQCSVVPPKEAVFNGDFEKGWLTTGGTKYADGSGIGFKTDLSYAGDYNGGVTSCWNSIPDQFGVGKTDGVMHNCDFTNPNNPYAGGSYLQATQFKDHTPGKGGNGFAFIGDFKDKCAGNTSDLYTGGKPVLWAQDVTIIPSQKYSFSAWFAQYTFQPDNAVLRFVVIPKDGSGNLLLGQRVEVGTATPANSTMQWRQFSGLWTPSTNYTSALIAIEVDASITNCNQAGDFALDDISFINGCQNLNGSYVPTFPSPIVNLCSTTGSIDLSAAYNVVNSANDQITWYKGSGTTQTVASTGSLSLTGISATDTYRICITDPDNALGSCPLSATVVVVKSLSVDLPSPVSLCNPATATLSPVLNPTATTGTYHYDWTVPTGATDPGDVSSATANVSGSYSLTVTNPSVSGCTGSDNSTVNSLLPTYTAPGTWCYGDVNKTITGTGANRVNYKWYTTLGGVTPFSTGATATVAGPIPSTGSTYSVYLEDATLVTVPGSPLGTSPPVTGTSVYNTDFTAFQSFILKSVQLAPQGSLAPCAGATGNYRIELYKAGSFVQALDPVSLTCGSVNTVNLNWNITPGNYFLMIKAPGGGAASGWFGTVPGAFNIPGYLTVAQPAPWGGPFSGFTIVQGNNCARVKIDIPIQDCCAQATGINNPTNQTICPNSAATFSVNAATSPNGQTLFYEWFRSTNGGTTWTSVKASGSAAANRTYTTGTYASATTDIYKVIIYNGGAATCPISSNTASITVNALPTVTFSGTATICSGATTSITLNSSIAGSTFAWAAPTVTGGITGASAGSGSSIAQTLTAGSTSGTVTYPVIATANTCPGAATNVVITVNPKPTVTATGTTICSGTAPSIALTSNVAGATFAWPAPTVTGGITGASAGSGTPIAQTLTGGPGTVTYAVTGTANSCSGTATNVVITVDPKPTVTATGTTICSGTAPSIALTSNVAGATFAWPAPTVTGGITGASAGSGTPIAQTLTGGPGTVTYAVTATANSCSGSATNVVITVDPKPTVTATGTTICSGTAPSIALTSNVAGATFAWPAPTVTGGVTGASAGSGTPIAQTLTGGPGTVTYAVTGTANGCSGTATNVVVTVNPVVAITTQPLPSGVCAGSNTSFNVVATGAVSYQWYGVLHGMLSNGGKYSNVTTSTLTLTAVTSAEADDYYVMVTGASPCVPLQSGNGKLTITSTEFPNVTIAVDKTQICEGTAVKFTATGSGTGTTPVYKFFDNLNNPLTGGTQTNVSTTQAEYSITLSNNLSVYAQLTSNSACIDPTATNPKNSTTVSVTVDKVPTVSSAGTAASICATGTNLAGNTPTVGTGVWTTLPPTPATSTPAITTPGSATSAVTGLTAPGAYTFQWTISNGLCPSSSSTVTITNVGSVTTPVAGNDATICVNQLTYTLNGNTPGTGETGTWTINGGTGFATIAAGTANNPAATLTGLTPGTIIARWTISNGICIPSPFDEVTITVDALPTASNAGPAASICANGTTLAGNTPTIGAGLWTAGSGISFGDATSPTSTVSGLLTGPNTLTWIISNGTCPSSSTDVIITNVGNVTTPDAGPDDIICSSQTSYTLQGNAVGTGETGTWTIKSGPGSIAAGTTNNPNATLIIVPGTIVVTWTISNGVCTPSPSNDVTITVSAQPANLAVSDDNICEGSNAAITITASESGIRYNVIDLNTSAVLGSMVGTGQDISIPLTVSGYPAGVYTNIQVEAVGCAIVPLTDKPTITILGNPGSIIGDPWVCMTNNSGRPYSISPVPGASTYRWELNTNTLPDTGPSASITFGTELSNTIIVTPITANGKTCNSSQPLTVIQIDAPQPLVFSEDTICVGGIVDFTVPNLASIGIPGWNPSGAIDKNNSSNSPKKLQFNTAGDITVEVFSGTSKNQCGIQSKTIHVIPTPVAYAGQDIHLDNMVPTELDGRGSSTGTEYKYVWTPSSSMTPTTANTLTPHVTPTDLHNIYTLTVSTTNTASCSATDEVEVIVEPLVHVPNVFSPNGDGNHDVLVIRNIHFFPKSVIYIYNQWGELIHKGPATNPWDGTRNGTEVGVSAYYYVLELNQEGFKPLAGSVSVIR